MYANPGLCLFAIFIDTNGIVLVFYFNEVYQLNDPVIVSLAIKDSHITI